MSRTVTGHVSEGSFVRNVVVQIPKFDAKPNHNPNPSHSPHLKALTARQGPHTKAGLARSPPQSSPKEELLERLVQDFYRLDVLSVAHLKA